MNVDGKEKNGIGRLTALLLAGAAVFALVRAAGGVRQAGEKLLLASAVMTMPQGASALFRRTDEQAGQQSADSDEPPEPPSAEASASEEKSRLPEGRSGRAPEEKSGGEETSGSAEESAEESEPAEESPAPEIAPDNAGVVIEKKYTAVEGGIYIAYGNGIIKNSTSLTRTRILKELDEPFGFVPDAEAEGPLVLIVHTHATESYEPYGTGVYDRRFPFRSTDNSVNVVSVGETLMRTLEQNGIPTAHATVQHDDPSYNGSYSRSAETVKKYLELYPTIRFVLDIHRDAIEPQPGRILKPTTEIDGRKAAQVMIISGCDDGTMDMPDYFENLRFAAALQDRMETLFPGLTRPVFFCYRKYNMDLSPGALLIEVGSHGNTLEEAKYSAELIGRALAELLRGA